MSTTEYKRTPITLTSTLILFVGGAVLFGGFLEIRHLWEARHPAVSEHRVELVQAAVKVMGCESIALTIIAEEPTRARVEGCNRSTTFRWGRVRGKSLPEHWHEIDPSCRIDYMGFKVPCG
jgi:hypothetical protein